jgi:hypothetical protein
MSLVLLIIVMGCKTVVKPSKPVQAPPTPPKVAIRARASAVTKLPLIVTPKSWTRLPVPGKLTITNLTVFNGNVTLGWTGTKTNQVLWSQDAKSWLPFGFPTTSHTVTLPQPASVASFRVVGSAAATNALDFGGLFLDSQFVDASNGVSAFIAHDILQAIPYLVTYDRQGVVHRYVIPGVVPNDLYSGAEVALLGGEVLITTVNTLTAQARIIEYSMSDSGLTLTNNILTGDVDSRTPDILKMRDGTIVVSFAEQGGGLFAWFLHRDPSGTWFDDGPLDLGSTSAGEVTAVIRLFERPSGGVYTVGLKDSGGFLRISKLELLAKGSNVSTNFDLVNSQISQYGHAAIHGEIPYSMIGTVDGENNRVLFTYVNQDLCYTTNSDPDLRLSMARVVTMAWNADNSSGIALLSPDPTVPGATNSTGWSLAINPGATERVYGFYNLGLSPLALQYVPLTQSADQTYPFYCPLTKFTGTASTFIGELSGYQNACHHRVYSDAVGTAPNGHVFVIMNQ